MIPWIVLLLLIVVYCITLPSLLKRAGVKNAVLGYIPIVQFVPFLQAIKRPWWWFILLLVPGVNMIMLIIINIELGIAFNKRSTKDQWTFGALPWFALPPLAFKDTQSIFVGPRDWTGKKKSTAREWGEAIVFAVVAASVIRSFFIEAFTIPTGSMENSMLVGDYLFVSKVSYGAKLPQTPMSVPFVHNALPGSMTNSYVDWFSLPYFRLPGLGKVERYDAVVFNFPNGDTILVDPYYAGHNYHELLRGEAIQMAAVTNKVTTQEQAFNIYVKNRGKYEGMARNNFEVKKTCLSCGGMGRGVKIEGIRARPMDKKENYVKRCIGLPGETLEIRDRVVYINGSPIETPEGAMFDYLINFSSSKSAKDALTELEVAPGNIMAEWQKKWVTGMTIAVPLTAAGFEKIKTMNGIDSIVVSNDSLVENNMMSLFPNSPMEQFSHSTRDNFGPIHIPAKGETINLTPENIAIYKRSIIAYESNTWEQRDGAILINGQPATSYTFKQDYYWMMGDNRHHSADSRYWGWVPEDHVVGKPVFTWLSKNQPGHNGNSDFRFNRMFKTVK